MIIKEVINNFESLELLTRRYKFFAMAESHGEVAMIIFQIEDDTP